MDPYEYFLVIQVLWDLYEYVFSQIVGRTLMIFFQIVWGGGGDLRFLHRGGGAYDFFFFKSLGVWILIFFPKSYGSQRNNV